MKSTRFGLHVLVLAAAAFTFTVTAIVASAQAPAVHGTPRLAAPAGNIFYRLTADGSHILVNHSPNGGAEELVIVPRDGTTEQVWIACPGRRIYNRIAVSGDGSKVAFAYSAGSDVHVLDEAAPRGRSPASLPTATSVSSC
jgi:hypothetical protein